MTKHRHVWKLKGRAKGPGGIEAVRFVCACGAKRVEALAARWRKT